MASEPPPQMLDEFAMRKLLAIELRRVKANGLARKVEKGHTDHPFVLAAINLGMVLSGKDPIFTNFVRDHS